MIDSHSPEGIAEANADEAREPLSASEPRVNTATCAHCGKAWPCDLAGLYPHRWKAGVPMTRAEVADNPDAALLVNGLDAVEQALDGSLFVDADLVSFTRERYGPEMAAHVEAIFALDPDNESGFAQSIRRSLTNGLDRWIQRR